MDGVKNSNQFCRVENKQSKLSDVVFFMKEDVFMSIVYPLPLEKVDRSTTSHPFGLAESRRRVSLLSEN